MLWNFQAQGCMCCHRGIVEDRGGRGLVVLHVLQSVKKGMHLRTVVGGVVGSHPWRVRVATLFHWDSAVVLLRRRVVVLLRGGIVRRCVEHHKAPSRAMVSEGAVRIDEAMRLCRSLRGLPLAGVVGGD